MAKKAAAKKVPAKKVPAKKTPTQAPAAKADYPWLRNRLASAVVNTLPDEHRPAARKAFKELDKTSEIFAAASEFGFDNSDEAVVKFYDDFISAGVTAAKD